MPSSLSLHWPHIHTHAHKIPEERECQVVVDLSCLRTLHAPYKKRGDVMEEMFCDVTKFNIKMNKIKVGWERWPVTDYRMPLPSRPFHFLSFSSLPSPSCSFPSLHISQPSTTCSPFECSSNRWPYICTASDRLGIPSDPRSSPEKWDEMGWGEIKWNGMILNRMKWDGRWIQLM